MLREKQNLNYIKCLKAANFYVLFVNDCYEKKNLDYLIMNFLKIFNEVSIINNK